MESIIGHRFDHNGVGALMSHQYTYPKIDPYIPRPPGANDENI